LNAVHSQGVRAGRPPLGAGGLRNGHPARLQGQERHSQHASDHRGRVARPQTAPARTGAEVALRVHLGARSASPDWSSEHRPRRHQPTARLFLLRRRAAPPLGGQAAHQRGGRRRRPRAALAVAVGPHKGARSAFLRPSRLYGACRAHLWPWVRSGAGPTAEPPGRRCRRLQRPAAGAAGLGQHS
jgi:hypothetical protein